MRWPRYLLGFAGTGALLIAVMLLWASGIGRDAWESPWDEAVKVSTGMFLRFSVLAGLAMWLLAWRVVRPWRALIATVVLYAVVAISTFWICDSWYLRDVRHLVDGRGG